MENTTDNSPGNHVRFSNETASRTGHVSQTLICIRCPLGCRITVDLSGKDIRSITGNTCKRGEDYARREMTAPARTVTTTVRVSGGSSPMVPVKTKTDIPKDKIFDCIRCLKDICVSTPVHIGDVILTDAAGTGVDIVATKEIPRM